MMYHNVSPDDVPEIVHKYKSLKTQEDSVMFCSS